MTAKEANLERLTAASIDAEREALSAAAFVGLFVAIPVVVATGAVLVMFALTSVVLLGPVLALALTWVAWRYGRPSPHRGALAGLPRER